MAFTLHQSSLCGRVVPANKPLSRPLPMRRTTPQAVAATADRPSTTDRQPNLSTSGNSASYAASQQFSTSEDLQSIASWLRSELTRNFRDGVIAAYLSLVVYMLHDVEKNGVLEQRGVHLQEVSSARYSPTFSFSDPIFQSTGLDSYRQQLRLLTTVFDISFSLHMVTTIPEKEQIITRRVVISHYDQKFMQSIVHVPSKVRIAWA